MTDYLTKDGQVCGAVGVDTRTGDLYHFTVKAIVAAIGGSNRLSCNPGGFDFNLRTPPPMCGDDISMSLRAGLSIINIEFRSNILGSAACGGYSGRQIDYR